MSTQKLPKVIQAAVNRNAFRIAMTEVYARLRREMEQRAQTLMSQPHATINEVIAVLDSNHILQTSAPHEWSHGLSHKSIG